MDEKTGKIHRFAFTHVKDLSIFLFFLIGQRQLEPHETEAHLGLDKGGKLLILTLTALQQTEIEGEPQWCMQILCSCNIFISPRVTPIHFIHV